uniref:Uncharacterized protein n=1 Tax=Anguilla anguilla TaxID=7936 RepID=A0A0E9RV54_ANGAN
MDSGRTPTTFVCTYIFLIRTRTGTHTNADAHTHTNTHTPIPYPHTYFLFLMLTLFKGTGREPIRVFFVNENIHLTKLSFIILYTVMESVYITTMTTIKKTQKRQWPQLLCVNT